jgi:hypothetical protein
MYMYIYFVYICIFIYIGMEYGGDDELDDDEAREVAKRERRRQVAMAPAGQKNLRERMNARKMRDKEKSVGRFT